MLGRTGIAMHHAPAAYRSSITDRPTLSCCSCRIVPLYYFNLRNGHLHVLDTRGENCTNPGEALEHAVVAVLDLTTREGRFRNWARWAIEVEDEHRRRVATLPFSLVLKSHTTEDR